MLETWDDRVCDTWEVFPPEKTSLNCDEWLLESPVYQNHNAVINHFISQAYEKIDEKTSTVIDRPISKFFCHIFLQQVTRSYKSEDEI